MFFQMSIERIGAETHFEKTLSHMIYWGNAGVRDFVEFEKETLSIFRREFAEFNPSDLEEDYFLGILSQEKRPWDKMVDYSNLENYLSQRIRKDVGHIRQNFYYQNPD